MVKDIIITLNSKTKKAIPNRDILGCEGEHLQGNFIVEFEDEFIDGVCWLETQCETEKSYIVMEKQSDNTYMIPIKSCLTTKAGEISFQVKITQTEVAEEIPIFKSNIFRLKVFDSINAVKEETEEYPEWLDVANSKLAEVCLAIERANTISADLEEKVANDYYRGEKGEDGTNDYEVLINKPKINGVELFGNKTNDEIEIKSLTNSEMENLLK